MGYLLGLGGGQGPPSIVSLNYALGDTVGGGVQSIQITGLRLTGTTSVTFGGTTATITGNTATLLTVTLPAHASGSVDVVVTTPGGSTTSINAFEYWTPTQITNVDFYVDSGKGFTEAAGTATWLDQGPNGVNFTNSGSAGTHPVETASVFGSIPSLRWAQANNQTMSCTQRDFFTAPTGISIFAVIQTTTSDTTISASSGACPLSITGDQGNGNQSFGLNGGAVGYAFQFATVGDSRGSGLTDGVAHLIGVTHLNDDISGNGSPGTIKAYIGAVQQGADATQVYNGTGLDTIGNGFGVNDGFDGDLGSVVVVRGIITGGDLTKLNNWSQQRFGTV